MKLVTARLGLKLNEAMANLSLGRVAYGYQEELMLTFTVFAKSGIPYEVTEDTFAASKKQAEIGIFGTDDPTEAVRQLVKAYPKATLLMRKEPKPRRIL